MGREKKFKSIFQSDSSVYYKIEIYDNEATSSTLHEPVLSSRGFDLTYQTEDENRFTGLIPSELVFDMIITSNAQQALINEIKISVYGRWQIGVYRSDDDSSGSGTYTLFWCGNLLNDINPEQDVAYPREFS